MFSFFQNFLKKPTPPGVAAPRDPERYDREKRDALSPDIKKRMTLARSTKTHQEILYYLAEKDPDPAVRRAVAENAAMPVPAGPVLAIDANADVRLALARRLISLLPDLSRDTQSQLYAYAAQALVTLALDQVLNIRKALSSALKDHAGCPPRVAGQLARDVEREVAEPVLRFCAALSDDDIIEILGGHPAAWAVTAVASRERVSAPVAQAVIETECYPAGAALLRNEGAVITDILLEQIVERARTLPEWHEPIALRKGLTSSAARELAEFVDPSVRDILSRRGDFDPQTAEEIAAVFRRRLEFSAEGSGAEKEPAARRVARLAASGALNEEAVSDALGMRDRAFVIAALAHLTRAKEEDVEKILDMRAPRPMIALCWKAGLSMRLALSLQQGMGHVVPKEILYPRNGTDFPMTDEELRWQIEFLGLD